MYVHVIVFTQAYLNNVPVMEALYPVDGVHASGTPVNRDACKLTLSTALCHQPWIGPGKVGEYRKPWCPTDRVGRFMIQAGDRFNE